MFTEENKADIKKSSQWLNAKLVAIYVLLILLFAALLVIL